MTLDANETAESCGAQVRSLLTELEETYGAEAVNSSLRDLFEPLSSGVKNLDEVSNELFKSLSKIEETFGHEKVASSLYETSKARGLSSEK